jgi:hypothetical protein
MKEFWYSPANHPIPIRLEGYLLLDWAGRRALSPIKAGLTKFSGFDRQRTGPLQSQRAGTHGLLP